MSALLYINSVRGSILDAMNSFGAAIVMDPAALHV